MAALWSWAKARHAYRKFTGVYSSRSKASLSCPEKSVWLVHGLLKGWRWKNPGINEPCAAFQSFVAFKRFTRSQFLSAFRKKWQRQFFSRTVASKLVHDSTFCTFQIFLSQDWIVVSFSWTSRSKVCFVSAGFGRWQLGAAAPKHCRSWGCLQGQLDDRCRIGRWDDWQNVGFNEETVYSKLVLDGLEVKNQTWQACLCPRATDAGSALGPVRSIFLPLVNFDLGLEASKISISSFFDGWIKNKA